ncbi:hypothetical protein [Ekhidna sp.]|uniref:hypothetical protein n=1 Tax=Ekhidna sp. TaxID=2608089 RepID=UPI003299AD82
MTRLFLVVVLSGAIAFQTMAHNAKIATYTLRDTGAGWFIEMNFAQAAVDAQMLKMHDKEVLSKMNKDDYKKSFLKYLTENIHLRVDGKKIKFVSGGILLGSHQTDVKYILPEISGHPQNMSVYLPMFEHIYNQTNLFRIYRGGDKFSKFFLSTDNDFSANLKFTGQGIISVNKAPSNNLALISGVVVLLFLVLVAVVLIKNRLKNAQLGKA